MGKPHIPLPEIRAAVEACHRCPLSQGARKRCSGWETLAPACFSWGKRLVAMRICRVSHSWAPAGHMLNDLLAIAGLSRDDVYIANVLKCRPPGNRDPRPEEIELCAPFLREQTRTIMPDFIVTLGKFATQFILKTEVGITRLHGTLQRAGRFSVFPIYHPAAALYDGSKREALENDFATLGELLRQAGIVAAAPDGSQPGGEDRAPQVRSVALVSPDESGDAPQPSPVKENESFSQQKLL